MVIVDKQNSFAIQINLFMGLGRLMDVQIVIEYFASYEFIMGKIKFTFCQKYEMFSFWTLMFLLFYLILEFLAINSNFNVHVITAAHPHSTSISACGVWGGGGRARVQVFKRELHTHIYLD